jgi:hypothetical protein
MPDPTSTVSVPQEEFDKMASVPLRLAQLEAAQMVRAGDVAGANARIAAGVAESAAFRSQAVAQAAAQQQAQQQPAQAQQQPVPAPPQAPRNASEALIQHLKASAASQIREGDPRRDMRQSYGLTSLRK